MDYKGGRSSGIYYINSKNRITGTDSDFTHSVDLRGLDNPTHCKILHIYIPKSYYSVASPYNTFTLSEDGYEVLITIPEGNYTMNNLKNKLSEVLTAESPNDYTYVVSSNNTNTEPEDGKLTFNVSNNGGIQPRFIFDNETRIHEIMGFDRNSTYFFANDVLRSPNVIILTGEKTLYLQSDLVGEGDNHVLQEIYTANEIPFGSVIYDGSGSEYGKTLSTGSNNVFRFYLTDENDQPINLNGLGIVMTLLVYRETNYFNLFNSFFNLLKAR